MAKNKKENVIRFLQQENEDEEQGEQNPGIAPNDSLKKAINALYYPAENVTDADDMLSHIELYEKIAQFCETNLTALFLEMKNEGFCLKNVEGTMYWLIKNQ